MGRKNVDLYSLEHMEQRETGSPQNQSDISERDEKRERPSAEEPHKGQIPTDALGIDTLTGKCPRGKETINLDMLQAR